MKSTKSGSLDFKDEFKSLEEGRLFLPLELVKQRGLPFESKDLTNASVNK